MHTVVRTSFADKYLTFLCSIFLAHNRVFVFSSSVNLDKIGPMIAIGLVPNSPLGGKVMEHSLASLLSITLPSLIRELLVVASARCERKGNW